jgi:hypothetical protein
VEQVHDHDPTSTFFRYPVTRNALRDREKSPFEEVDFPEIASKSKPGNEYIKALLLFDENENLKNTFVLDKTKGGEIGEALEKLSSYLSGIHFALRAELLGGL